MRGSLIRKLLVTADETGEAALDADLFGTVALGRIMAVGGVELDHLAVAAERLQRRLGLVNQGDDDLPVARRVDLADEREVAVENSFLDHRIARHLERIMLARAEQGCGDGEAFAALQRLDRRAGGD